MFAFWALPAEVRHADSQRQAGLEKPAYPDRPWSQDQDVSTVHRVELHLQCRYV